MVETLEEKIEKLEERIEHIKNEIDRALDYYENEPVCKDILKKALTK